MGPSGKSTYLSPLTKRRQNSSLLHVYEPAALEMKPPASADHMHWDFGRPYEQTHSAYENSEELFI